MDGATVAKEPKKLTAKQIAVMESIAKKEVLTFSGLPRGGKITFRHLRKMRLVTMEGSYLRGYLIGISPAGRAALEADTLALHRLSWAALHKSEGVQAPRRHDRPHPRLLLAKTEATP